MIRAVGTPRPRIEGPLKVTGAARYAADERRPGMVWGWIVTAAISRGHIAEIDAKETLSMPGVLGVLDHHNAPRLNPDAGNYFGPDGTLQYLQSDAIPYAGRPIALVVAETMEQARAAAAALKVTYNEEPHDGTFSVDHPAKRPASQAFGPEANTGDLEAELAASAVVVDEVYRTPEESHSAMEPHAATAWWEDGHIYAIDSNQGPFSVSQVVSTLFQLDRERVHIRAEHVGGGFGAKTGCGPQLVFAIMASFTFDRPVRVVLTREQVFLSTAARPTTQQRMRIGADAEGHLRALHHDAVYSVSPLAEYIEWCIDQSHVQYASPAIRTHLSVVPLDLLPPDTMRGPGATPGSFALESAIDEVVERLGMDPVGFRLRNQPDANPVTGHPFSSRRSVECLREGARRFGWAGRDHRPRMRREGHLLVGTGVATASFSAGTLPSSATITGEADGTFTVGIAASDIGTGARTALIALAADALGVGVDLIRIRMADSDLGMAWNAGGSRGTTSWSFAILEAARRLREKLDDPIRPVSATADTTTLINYQPPRERQTFSAVFAEVTVDPATGEVRVRRLLGMFAVGRVVNPLLARSQLSGAMIMGLSMALHEESVRDPRSARDVNGDFAGYHIAAHADVPDVEADFVPDYDSEDPVGINGLGEIGTAGTAAAIANAVWHATGKRHRTLPIRLDRVLEPPGSSHVA